MQVTVMAAPSIRVLHLAAWSIGLGVRLLLAVAFILGAGQLALAQQDKGPVILKVHSLGVQAINFSPNGKTLGPWQADPSRSGRGRAVEQDRTRPKPPAVDH